MEKVILEGEHKEKLDKILANYSRLIKTTISPKVNKENYKLASNILRQRSAECFVYLDKYKISDDNTTHKLEDLLVGHDKIKYLMFQVRDLRKLVRSNGQ